MDMNEYDLVTNEDREFFDLFAGEEEEDNVDSFLEDLKNEKTEIFHNKASKYLLDFQKSTKDDGVFVSSVDKSILEESKQIRAEQEKEKASALQRYFKALKEAKPTAKRTYRKFYRETERKKNQFFKERRKRHRELMSNLKTTFQRGQRFLNKKLRTRKRLVEEHYGSIKSHKQTVSAHRQFAQCKEVLSVELKYLSGIREKLPPGDYIILMSLRDKIDGTIVKGTEIQVSEFIHVSGRYDDYRSKLMTERFLPIPAQKFRTPYLCIQFSVVQIRGTFPGLCCGWGIFPLQDYQFDVNYGLYKVPILRGWREEMIFKFSQIHKILKRDLNNWMGNLYIELKSDEKYFKGTVENEFKMQHLKNEVDLYFISMGGQGGAKDDDVDDDLEDNYDVEDVVHTELNEEEMKMNQEEDVYGWASSSKDRARRRRKRRRERRKKKERERDGQDDVAIDFSDDEDYDEEGPSEDDNPTGIKQRLFEDDERKDDVVLKIDPNDPEYLSNNATYSLKKPFGYKESIVKKGKYLSIIILNDLGLRINRFGSLLSIPFFTTLFLFIFSFFIRLYSYYFFQFAYMKWFVQLESGVQYSPNFLWVDLKYQYVDQLTPFLEFLNLVLGNFGNVGILLSLIGMVWVSQRIFKTTLPLFAHKFVVCFGFNVAANTFYNMFFDLCRQNWKHADMLKIYFIYSSSDSEFLGVLLIMSFFSWFLMIVFILEYYFLLHVFMNGQIIDIYRRINGTEKNFFIPQDNEVCIEELYYAIEKSKKYRGKNGEVRTTMIWEYAEKDPKLKHFKHFFIHIVILTIPTNKKYREFLYSSKDRSIVEVYEGQLNAFLKNMKYQDVENLIL